MTAFAELDIAARTDQLAKARRELDALTASAARTEDAAQDAGAAVTNAGQQMGAAGGNTRMFAQQLSQVAQQGAATGQWMQALTIQAADIGMAFGTIGAIAGTLATIAMPALISALSNTGGQAAEVEAALDALSEATDTYREAVEALGMSSVEMAENYGTMTGAAREFLAAMADVAGVTAIESLRSSIETLTGPMLSLQQFADDGSASWYRLAEQLGVTQQQADWLSLSLQSLASAGGPEQQAAAAQALADRLMAAAGSYENMNASSRMLYDNAVKIGLEAAKLVGTTEAAGKSANTMAGFFDSTRQAAEAAAVAAAGIGNAAAGAIGQVQGLAKAMWDAAQGRIAANKAIDAMQVGGVGSGGGTQYLASQYALYGQGRVAGDTAENNADPLYNPPAIGTGVGSGAGSAGGGVVESFQDRLNGLMGAMQTERELTDQWYEESQAILADRRAMEILGEEEHRLALIGVEEEYQARLAEIRQQASDAEIGMRQETVNMALGLLQQLGEKSKALAAVAVAVNAAQRVAEIKANTAAAVMRAYAELGPIAGSAAAIKIKAMGAMQTGLALAGAALQLGGGGSGGGSASIGGAGSSGARGGTMEPAAQTRFLRIEVNGEGMFAQALRDNVQSIADAITDLSGRGGTTLVVGR